MSNLLVTGGAGFIGANFVHHLRARQPESTVVNLDKLTYAADLENLTSLAKDPLYRLVEGDICDRGLLEDLFETYQFEGVFHFAAESHVDNSIASPGVFIETNVVGTFTLLDVARQFWLKDPFVVLPAHRSSRFHNISTDEVYGSLGLSGYFTEDSKYQPNSPYSASKAGSDLLVRSYHHTYGLNTVTTNCSNNYGPFQNREKLIPTVVHSAVEGRDIPVYGKGENVRDWLFVEDHCSAIYQVFDRGRAGGVYNVGGNCEKNNLELVGKICSVLDRLKPRTDGKAYNEQIQFVKDRPGHDLRYAIDTSKLENELAWKPAVSFNEGIEKTVRWYLSRLQD